MAASISSQPPKPPPPPPKVETAPKADAKVDAKPAVEAKPAAQASPAPRPAQIPDLFEQKSGGGRPLPTSGGSSFAPAVSAAQNQLRDAVGSANSTVRSALTDAAGGVRSDLQSALGSANDAAWQNGATLTGLNDLGALWGGGPGPVGGTPTPNLFFGGAPGGVADRTGLSLNLQGTFSSNFGPGSFLQDPGGGGKPGIGGGFDFLSALGGGAGPGSTTTTTQPAISTQTSNDSNRRGPFDFGGFGGFGNHLGLFNFGSARGGGGGAAGGVADRWDR